MSKQMLKDLVHNREEKQALAAHLVALLLPCSPFNADTLTHRTRIICSTQIDKLNDLSGNKLLRNLAAAAVMRPLCLLNRTRCPLLEV